MLNVLGEFDFFTKYSKISHFNRDLNSMKNQLIVIFLTIYLFFVVIKNSIILIIIDDNHEFKLKELGDYGYLIGGKGTRFMFDAAYLTFWTTIIVYLIQYQMSDNQWIFKINEIYQQIKTQSMEKSLKERTTKLIKLSKFITALSNILSFIMITAVYAMNFELSFIIVNGYFEMIFTTLVGCSLILRNIFISVFLCLKYIIVFNEINSEIIECFESLEMNSNDLKSYLNKHYKCCDSLKIANKVLKPIFITFIGGSLPGTCYCLYYFIYSTQSNYIDLMLEIVLTCFVIFALILSLMINMIDFEAKKALHFIHGFALINKDKYLAFQVFFLLNKLKIIIIFIFQLIFKLLNELISR